MPGFNPVGRLLRRLIKTVHEEQVYRYELPSIERGTTAVQQRYLVMAGTTVKEAYPLTTDYIKQAIILPTGAVVADPAGAIVSYEGGWVCRALIYKAGTGEVELAKKVLDEFVKMQHPDGSWDQQYYPTRKSDGTYPIAVRAGEPYRDIQVDSGAALLAWAMAEYDAKMGSAVYRETVRKAFDFLRECQVQHNTMHPESLLLANQRWDYVAGSPKWNHAALTADSAECLLAALAALDAYGSALTNTKGYSIRKFANDVYRSLATLTWTGNPDPAGQDDNYFRTEYPPRAPVWLMPGGFVPQGISYTQALAALAIYKWAKSAHKDPALPDYSHLCKRALNWAVSLLQGKWGGFYYHPPDTAWGMGISGDGYGLHDEFPAFTALMVIAMKAVDPDYYANHIVRAVDFIRLASLPGGRVFNRIKIDGIIDLGEANVPGDSMHFRALNAAQGLLAGA